EAKLLRGAQHALALDASQRGLLDFDFPEERSDRRQRRFHSCPDIRRAANDLHLRLSGVHHADRELVRIRMTFEGNDFGNDDALERRRDGCERFHLEPGHCQKVRQLLYFYFYFYKVLQPIRRNIHANCLRKRRSPSKKRRKSSMP